MRWIQGFDFDKDGRNDAYVVHDLGAAGGCLPLMAIAIGFPLFCLAVFVMLLACVSNLGIKTSAPPWLVLGGLAVASVLIVFAVFIWLPISLVYGPSKTTKLFIGLAWPALRILLSPLLMLHQLVGVSASRGFTAGDNLTRSFDAWLRRSTGQELYAVWAAFCYVLLPLMVIVGVVVAAWN